MSRRSFIFNSEAGRYLAIFALSGASLLALVGTLSAYGYKNGLVAFDFVDLYLYQRAKLRDAPAVDTVLVGDSSLGNGIDASLWTRRTGRPTLNLALTGSFGYAGSLNMIRHASEHAALRRVIVFQTPDMATRAVSHAGYLHTTGRLFPFGEVPVRVMFDAYVNLDTAWAVGARLFGDRRAPNLDPGRDYIRQGRPVAQRPGFVRGHRELRLDPARINSANLFYLGQIARLCRDAGLECIYAHGPILESYCENSREYFEAVNGFLKGAGMEVVAGTPACMPLADAGDSEDHVAPERRAAYTERYIALIQKAFASRELSRR